MISDFSPLNKENHSIFDDENNLLTNDYEHNIINFPSFLNSKILEENFNSLDNYYGNDRNYDYMKNFDKNDYIENETTNQNSKTFLKKKIKREEEETDNGDIQSKKEENISENKSNYKENINNNKEEKQIEIKNKHNFYIKPREGNIENNLDNKSNNKKYSKYGRKTKEEKNNGINGNHTRYSDDNIIRKIKTFFGKSLHKFINQNLKNENFKKLEIAINKDLKKDFNLKLFKMTIKEIYSKSNISDKYRYEEQNKNENLIKEIYSKNEETSVIKILNLTYLEAFEIFRRNIKENQNISPYLQKKIEGTDILDNKKFEDILSLFEKIIKEEEKNKNGNIEQYINDVKHLCLNFEKWFENKVGRER